MNDNEKEDKKEFNIFKLGWERGYKHGFNHGVERMEQENRMEDFHDSQLKIEYDVFIKAKDEDHES